MAGIDIKFFFNTKSLLRDLLEQKPTYEACLTYGELALHTTGKPFVGLKDDLEKTIERWDTLCVKLEKCLNRLDVARVSDALFFFSSTDVALYFKVKFTLLYVGERLDPVFDTRVNHE